MEGRGPQTCGNPGQTEWRGFYPQAVLAEAVTTEMWAAREDFVSTDGPQK